MTAGRVLISVGLVMACLGALLVAAEKLNLPLGRLPGDLLWRNGNTTIYVPIVTCILLSVAGSFLLWLFGKH